MAFAFNPNTTFSSATRGAKDSGPIIMYIINIYILFIEFKYFKD